jgi:hypothetical protein
MKAIFASWIAGHVFRTAFEDEPATRFVVTASPQK